MFWLNILLNFNILLKFEKIPKKIVYETTTLRFSSEGYVIFPGVKFVTSRVRVTFPTFQIDVPRSDRKISMESRQIRRLIRAECGRAACSLLTRRIYSIRGERVRCLSKRGISRLSRFIVRSVDNAIQSVPKTRANPSSSKEYSRAFIRKRGGITCGTCSLAHTRAPDRRTLWIPLHIHVTWNAPLLRTYYMPGSLKRETLNLLWNTLPRTINAMKKRGFSYGFISARARAYVPREKRMINWKQVAIGKFRQRSNFVGGIAWTKNLFCNWQPTFLHSHM